MKAIYSIFKLSPARREDYLKVNELLERLENGKALDYFSDPKISPNDDRFTTILDKMGFPLHLATPEISLFICNEIEPFLTCFQAERALPVFLSEKLKELLTSIMGRFIRPAAFAANSSTRKMLKIDLKEEENLISSDNLQQHKL